MKDFMHIAMERANTIKQHAEADGIPMANRNPFFTIQEFIYFFQNI